MGSGGTLEKHERSPSLALSPYYYERVCVRGDTYTGRNAGSSRHPQLRRLNQVDNNSYLLIMHDSNNTNLKLKQTGILCLGLTPLALASFFFLFSFLL